MPNDRASASLLQNIDLKKYPKLGQFLTVQSISNKQEPKLLSNHQALNLLEEAISEVENQRLIPTNSATRTSRQKELDQLENVAVESTADLTDSEKLSQKEQQPIINKESQIEQPSSEQQLSAEAIKSSESAEIAELGQELAEIKEIDKELDEQELAKKQQATIDNLANQAQLPVTQVKPVVVLPITEKQQQLAKKKGIHFSLRWLAEWADKIKKIFAGAVLYKEEVENSADV
jgi:hypothetical protein